VEEAPPEAAFTPPGPPPADVAAELNTDFVTGVGLGAAGAVAPGDTVAGSLGEGDDGTAVRRQPWVLTLPARTRLHATMTSVELDPVLSLHRGEPGRLGTLLAWDGGASRGSAGVTEDLPAGTYTLLAGSGSGPAAGGYTLSVSVDTAEAAPPAANGHLAYDNTGVSTGRYALLVAAGDAGTVQDARALRDVLVERFEFRDEDIVLLSGPDVTRVNVANGVFQHLGQAGPDGVAVLFVAGEGIRTEGDVGLRRPLDPDPRGRGDPALLLADSGEGREILLDEELGFLVSALGAGRALAISAACYRAGDAPEGIRLPVNFLPAEPGVVRTGTMAAPSGEELGAMVRGLRDPVGVAVWSAADPEAGCGRPGEGSPPHRFGGRVARLLGAADPDRTLEELQAALAEDPGGAPDRTAPGPTLRGGDPAVTVEAFFARR